MEDLKTDQNEIDNVEKIEKQREHAKELMDLWTSKGFDSFCYTAEQPYPCKEEEWGNMSSYVRFSDEEACVDRIVQCEKDGNIFDLERESEFLQ